MKNEDKQRLLRAVKEHAVDERLEFWLDEDRRPWATVPENGHRENWAIGSRDFRLWVTNALFKIIGGPPPKSTVYDAIDEFEVWAVCRGLKHSTRIRLAASDGKLTIDLADEARRVVEIQGADFAVKPATEIKFIRKKGTEALPYPEVSLDNVNSLLNKFLNLPSNTELLFYAWLTNCLRASGPYPVLVLSGVQGSGKSTLTRIARLLIDPSVARLASLPPESRDLAIAAQNSHLLAFDNVSKINQRTSDDLCRLSTGGALRIRKLYTSDDETLLRFCKPVIVNGIEHLVLRSDLLDRSILIQIPTINATARRTEDSFWSEFEDEYSQILGALYSATGRAMQILEEIRLEKPPRMADFARWGCAIEKVLGYADGQFLSEYEANRADANAVALEASPIADLIRDYLLHSTTFSGTARKLLQELTRFAEAGEKGKQKGVLKHPDFPKSPNALSALIARIEPNLLTENISIERTRNGNNKIIKLSIGERQ
jgi:hypothetical protein